MNTPTLFQIGKLKNVLKEISSGIGSSYTLVSYTDSDLRISLTIPSLSDDLKSINEIKEKVCQYFGLAENETNVQSSFRSNELNITSNGLIIKITNK